MKETDLILNPDGSIYHLKLKPEDLPDLILVAGDPDRIELISDHFDRIDFKRQNREFVSHAGWLNGKRLLALSTGIGPDNMDIVMNELDALANIDLKNRKPLSQHRTLDIVRLGTSGTLHADIPVGSFAVATHGLGLDGSLHFYKDLENVTDHELTAEFISQSGWPHFLASPYIIPGSAELIGKLEPEGITGITATGAGFYGPQGRELRLRAAFPGMLDAMAAFKHKGHRIINFEMETSSLYGLGSMLGHKTASICVILANRATGKYSNTASEDMNRMINYVLKQLII